jgi:hypothetical protein
MINALANLNRPPRLVKTSGGPRLPLFPAKYNWKEDERVRSALAKVVKEMTAEMWEELVCKIDDRRYCLTIKDKFEFHTMGNWTVGEFCVTLARDWLLGVCNQHLPNDPLMDGYKIRLHVGPKGEWRKWRKQRTQKQLYELQIEVCEETIRELAKVTGIPKRVKEEARRKIEQEIAKLTRTKRPIFVEHYSPVPIVTYTPEDAKEAREELRKEEKEKDRKKRKEKMYR